MGETRRGTDNDKVEMNVCGTVDKLDGRSLTGALHDECSLPKRLSLYTARKIDYGGRAKDVDGVLKADSGIG